MLVKSSAIYNLSKISTTKVNFSKTSLNTIKTMKLVGSKSHIVRFNIKKFNTFN